MRAVICRFRDEEEFLSHRDLAERAGARNGFMLLGVYKLEPGQDVSVRVLVRSAGERSTLDMQVLKRAPVASDEDGKMWRYLVEAKSCDTVWLDMLDEKMSMRHRVTPSAA